jgi:Fe-S oxidoreductase
MGIFSFFNKNNVLYFPGCISYYKYKDNLDLYKKIFDKLSIDYRLLEDTNCCGLFSYETGYEINSRKLARKNFETMKKEKITGIITTCPACYKMFLKDYPNFLPDWNIEVINIWSEILKRLEQKPGLIKNKANGFVSLQDSCYLSRYCGITGELRLILETLGYGIHEMKDNRENSFCSGSCGGLTVTNPMLADKIARERLMQAKREGIKKIVVFSLQDYNLLKNNLEGTGIRIYEISEILADSLGIKKLEETINNEEIIVNKTEKEEDEMKDDY